MWINRLRFTIQFVTRTQSLIARGFACASMVVLSACSFSASTGGLDYDKLEKAITDELNTTFEPIGQTVSDVNCPEQRDDPKKGARFLCMATLGGEDIRVQVDVTDDEYNVKFETLDRVYGTESINQTLADSVSTQVGFPAEVDCGSEPVKVVPDGQTFDCTLTDDQGGTGTLRVTANDDLSWEILN